MTRSLWLLSFTDLAALLLAFFALVVATSRFEPVPARGTVPIGVHPVAGARPQGGKPVLVVTRALTYRFGLVREGLRSLSRSCRPREVVLRHATLVAAWNDAIPLRRSGCVRELRRTLVPLANLPAVTVSLVRSAGAPDPRRVSWEELVEITAALTPPLPRPPRVLVSGTGPDGIALVFESGGG